ncbi:hypothetical protein TREES_T100011091 [Tupaia chinensis]|uniref:KANL2-like probable zinc-finger domain-containing protein n=1 Tax=Tupaia chinensis TaxID=246437 RepID=L8YHB4_TUPCH|nr:hypothetical protein TREES_T100011091 [Tupaia chinensis]
MILDQAFKYITELKRQNDELLLNGGNNEQAEEIKKLRKQLEEIQKENGRYIELLKANDICLYDDPTIHWKGNLKNSKVSVVIPTDHVQKNIIVYSNGSQPGGNSQGTAVQGITFNVGHNLQKQTANVVPVQRTCNLVTPVSISGVYPSENKPWHQTTVSALAANQPVPLCLPAAISAQNLLELSTSESESSVLAATSGSLIAVPVGSEPHQQHSLHTCPNVPNSSENRNGQESPKLLKKTALCATSIPPSSSASATKVQHGNKSGLSIQDFRGDFQNTLVVSVTTTVCSQPPRSAGVSSPASTSKSAESTGANTVVAPSAPGVGKTTTPVSTLSTKSLDSGWTRSCSLPSSSVSASDLKNINSLTRISSAGNTQTTWTTLQLAGNTIQPLTQTPSSSVTPVLSESGTSPQTTNHSRQVAPGIHLNNPFPADGQPVEQVVVTLPSCPSLPMQPLIAQPQVKSQPPKNILPLNSAMQVIQMAQPVGSAVNAAPANQNVIILQPPSTTPCPTVMRAEVPNQTVSQQIVIIQAANQNPLPLLSAPPPGSVRLPVNGASAIIGSNNPVQNVSAPQTFGGKHLVHILPRPSSLSTSNSTQTFSVTMSNQQQPQTISLNGQLFALQHQFKRLQHLLKEKQRRYLHNRKVEHEALGSRLLTGPEGLLAKERDNFKRLKCLRQYRQLYGVEALLHRQLKEWRMLATDGAAQQAHTTRSSQRCLAFVDDVHCSNQSLPMTRHCLIHIFQSTNQVLFKCCQGSEEVPCNKPVPVSLSEDPCCPLHFQLPPQMYKPEQVLSVPDDLEAGPMDLYLSAAELQPTESLPLEFRDDLDVVGDGMQCPPSPLVFDPSLTLDDHSIKDIAEGPVDMLGQMQVTGDGGRSQGS